MKKIHRDKDVSNKVGKVYIGEVVDNMDPEKLGRVKVMVPELFQGIPVAHLPWCATQQQNLRGAGPSIGALSVPRVGSRVNVQFESDEIRSGIVISEFNDGANPPDDKLLEDYPNSYGWSDENGTKFVINAQKQEVYFHHKGVVVTIDTDGNIAIDSPADVQLAHAGKVTVAVEGDVEIASQSNTKVTTQAQMDIEATGPLNLTGSAVSINSLSGNIAMVSGSGVASCQGQYNVIGDVTADGVSLKSHTHGGVESGSSDTGPPN